MVSRPSEYWLVRGLVGEARMWLDRLTAVTPDDHPERAAALCVNALYKTWLGDPDVVAPLVDGVAADDDVLRASVLHVRRLHRLPRSRPRRRAPLTAPHARTGRRVGRDLLPGQSLFGLALVEVEFGDVDAASDAAEQALRLDRAAATNTAAPTGSTR